MVVVVVGGGGCVAMEVSRHPNTRSTVSQTVLTLEESFLSTHFFSMSAVPITWC